MGTSLVVMQPTSFCNIDCQYCYVPERQNSEKMSDEILDNFYRVLFSSDLADSCRIIWHSGEPLSVGIDFYKNALHLQRVNNHQGRVIQNWIQTNGILLNDPWCDFLKANDIKISISLDGPGFIHDANRVNRQGKGTFTDVVAAIKLLESYDIEYQVLSVLTRKTLDYPDEYFNFFVDLGIEKLGFNIEELNIHQENPSLIASDYITEIRDSYYQFISRLFILWKNSYPQIEVRELSQMYFIINEKIKNPAFYKTSEEHKALDVIHVKKNGDISTFSPELLEGVDGDPDTFKLGNVKYIRRLSELLESEKYAPIQADVDTGMDICKSSCGYFDFCGGGHLSAKYYEHGTLAASETLYCQLHRQTMTQAIIDELSRNL